MENTNNSKRYSRCLIKKVGIIGSGTMGSAIAAHFINVGIECILLDIPNLNKGEDKNKIVKEGMNRASKIKPSIFYSKSYVSKLELGNLEEDIDKLKKCDWIIEVVVEKLEIKKDIFKKLEKIVDKDTIVSSNTSGISIKKMLEDLSLDFKKNFLVTHFFNPVRYLHLLELIPGEETTSDILEKITIFGEDVLGKGIVYGKDTTNFIANRIGIFSIMKIIKLMMEYQYKIEDLDDMFGQMLGRPKSAIFRTADIVGIDIFANVANNCFNELVDDSQREIFEVPIFIKKMISQKKLGQKTKEGFYKKSGKDILVIDYTSLEYRRKEKSKNKVLKQIKRIDNLSKRIKAIFESDDKDCLFISEVLSHNFIYAAEKIGIIADNVVEIDNAMKWGFGWEAGPFELWDMIGIENSLNKIKSFGLTIPIWINTLLKKGKTSFYDKINNKYWDILDESEKLNKSKIEYEDFTILKSNKTNIVKKNGGCSLLDLSDGVLLCEFHSKMNSIDDDIIKLLNTGLDLCEKGEFGSLVIGNHGANFSVGANLMLIYLNALNKNWKDIENMVKAFQDTCLRLKYSTVPTISVPFNLTLGGGAELSMWCTKIRASAELYMGLVEAGVGLIPGGGGSVELLSRILGDHREDKLFPKDYLISKVFETVGMAKVSTSAEEAKNLHFLKSQDDITYNRRNLLKEAKIDALSFMNTNYKPLKKRYYSLPGIDLYSTFEMSLYNMQKGGFISEHDYIIALKVAKIMTGGNTTSNKLLDEKQLFEIEREGFLSLCGMDKTLDRIKYTLEYNKPLRN